MQTVSQQSSDLDLFHALVRADDLLSEAASIAARSGMSPAAERIEGVRALMARSMGRVQDNAYQQLQEKNGKDKAPRKRA
ncbi:MAG: hypothetical protein GC166_05680 [Alphaproteobacteria bacterium]|nr:hypothetical protein [Alphaproteobacteria bacterium]